MTNDSSSLSFIFTDVPSLVKEYLESPQVSSNQASIDFTASILVFTTMTQEIAASVGFFSVPPSPLKLGPPSTALSASSLSYDILCQKYRLVKNRFDQAKAHMRERILSDKR